MLKFHVTARQRGAALVIGLILLMILTLLAFTGVSSSITELAMANNEQFQRNASQAATTGIERAIPALTGVPTTPGAAPTVVGPVSLPDSPDDKFQTRSRFVGEEHGLPQSSVDKFIGLHFAIDSDGSSVRNARESQTQGVMVVAATGGAGDGSFGRQGGGLE
jgi:type IV pilus assembly protein PilX